MFVTLHANVIVVTIRIWIADLIGGGGNTDVCPGRQTPSRRLWWRGWSVIRLCQTVSRLNSHRLIRHRQDRLVLSGGRCELGIVEYRLESQCTEQVAASSIMLYWRHCHRDMFGRRLDDCDRGARSSGGLYHLVARSRSRASSVGQRHTCAKCEEIVSPGNTCRGQRIGNFAVDCHTIGQCH